jgi:hypothetical protein
MEDYPMDDIPYNSLNDDLIDDSKSINETISGNSFLIGGINDIEVDIKIGESYQLGCDMQLEFESSSVSSISTQWSYTFLLFLVILFALPLYTLSVVVHIRKMQKNRLSKKSAYIIILLCTTIYIILWTFIGLWFRYISNWKELVFIIIFYCICCFSESILKTTESNNNSADVEKHIYNVRITANYINDSNKVEEGLVSIGNLISMIRRESVSKRICLFIRSLSLILGLLFSIITEISRWVFDINENKITVGFIVYIICGFILRFTLSSFIFFYLGETVIQLYSRLHQSKLFHALTSSSLSKKHSLPHIKLNQIDNIQGWQILRATLLYEYQQPKIYVDVVLSACFSIWLPLTVISCVHILLKHSATMFLITCLTISIFIFIYLILCVHMASVVRREFNHTEFLHLEEYRLLCSKDNKDKEIKLLQKLREIILIGNNKAIVFRIFGIGINQNFSTFIIGLVISGITTVFAKLLA